MRKKGVSLIVLIITIVVIIILATSIVVNLVKTNAMKKAGESVFKSDIRGFADELSLSLANEYLNYKGEFDAKKVNSYNNEVWYGDKKQDKTVQDVITNSKNTDYVGKIFIEDGELVLDGFELTKEEVKWAKEINIPVSFEKGVEDLVLTSDYTSVTVKVPVEKDEVIKEYEYTIYEIKEIDGKEEKNQVNTVTKKENETTFSGLAQNKLYEVNVKIRFNNEENEVIERTGRINTKGVEENVTFTQNPSAKKENGEINWTAGNVIVTISHKDIPEGYEIQYKLTDGMTQDWTSGEIVEITENTTLVVGRLYNKTLDDEVSVNSHVVSNIDKENPTAPTSVSISVTENTVIATATGSSDILSGFSKYQYSLNNGSWQDSGTFTNIKSGTDVTIQARAVDKVGNVSESKSSSDTTSSLGQVSISQSPTATTSTGEENWTSGNVTVTLSHTEVSGYTLQYKLSGGMTKDWTTYSSAITIDTNNTTVATRMYNSTLDDEGNSANAKEISNIDRDAPNSANINMSTESIDGGKTLTFNVTHSDDLSGINIENCRYEFSPTSENLGEDISKYTNSFEENGKDTTWTTVAGDYYLHVLSVDKAGNMTETITEQLHVHSESCYSSICKGTFSLSNSSTETYDTCTHTHTGNSSSYGGCYTSAVTKTCSGTMKVTGASSSSSYGNYKTDKCRAGVTRAFNFNTRCNSCSRTSTYYWSSSVCWCSSCGSWISGFSSDGSTAYESSSHYTSVISGGKCGASLGTTYNINCGKTAGTTNYTRTVETYTCDLCGKNVNYYNAASYGTCSRCGGNHSVSSSGAKSVEHESSEKYLICVK